MESEAESWTRAGPASTATPQIGRDLTAHALQRIAIAVDDRQAGRRFARRPGQVRRLGRPVRHVDDDAEQRPPADGEEIPWGGQRGAEDSLWRHQDKNERGG